MIRGSIASVLQSINESFRVTRESVRSTLERGPTLIMLYTVLGVALYLSWDAAAQYGFRLQVAVGVLWVVVWTGASVIALNTLIDSSTKLELSSMYLTDYKGIVWTTATLLVGLAVTDLVLLTTLSPAWFLVVVNGLPWMESVFLQPTTVTVTEWYAVMVQAASILATIYVAARLLPFPAYVAVESKDFRSALAASVAATRGMAAALFVPVVLALFSIPVFVAIGFVAAPAMQAQVVQLYAHPLLLSVAWSTVVTFFTAIGIVSMLAVVATAYSTCKQ